MRVITRSRGRRTHPQPVPQPVFGVLVPPSVPPVPPVFGYRFRRTLASDVLVEAFSSIGNYCMFCSTKKLTPEDMVLCQCGDFMCTNCFVNGQPCSECSGRAGVSSSNNANSIMPVGKEKSAKHEGTPANFVTTAIVTQWIDFGKQICPLEIRFETLRNQN